MIAVRIGWGMFAHTPDGIRMEFDCPESALAWATQEGLYEGATLDSAKAHGAEGVALDGWVDSHGLYRGAIVEIWEPKGQTEERWQCVLSARVMFPGEEHAY